MVWTEITAGSTYRIDGLVSTFDGLGLEMWR
jgi:hypothetical protein